MNQRTTVLKTYLNPDEHAAFHRACSKAGTTRAAKIREFCNNFAHFNDSHGRRRNEGPKPITGKAQYFPGHRASYGVVPRMRLLV